MEAAQERREKAIFGRFGDKFNMATVRRSRKRQTSLLGKSWKQQLSLYSTEYIPEILSVF